MQGIGTAALAHGIIRFPQPKGGGGPKPRYASSGGGTEIVTKMRLHRTAVDGVAWTRLRHSTGEMAQAICQDDCNDALTQGENARRVICGGCWFSC